MSTKVYFKNKNTGKKYEFIRLDKEKGEITLKGQYAEFTEPFNKARFEELGYEMVREEVPDDAPEDDDDA